ncbi:MAG: carboxylate-amine ligase [Acidiferrobacterales bacterium]|nr:carboxylate-amine ligase [Acidiferrobacterales bacterium]
MSEDTTITLGVEEEMFLVEPESGNLIDNPDQRIFDVCEDNSGPHKVVREFLRAQIETNTEVCSSIAHVRKAMHETRRIVIEAAEQYGLRALAASTHPFAKLAERAVTKGDRYQRYAMIFQEGLRRFVIGGMHIHAGFGDEESRIQVMTALRRYLPLLHALSTSSPFIEGRDTGFKSYRLTLVGGLPRTGLPSAMKSRSDYDRLLSEYQKMGFAETGGDLWWDIRPSHAYPTVELRICDVCPRIEDTVTIAALYACLIRRLSRLQREGELPEEPLTELIAENRWVAQRYGVFAFFGAQSVEGGRIDIEDLVAELIEELADDARALDCEAEIRRAQKIVREGTSADRQIDLYRLRLLEGDTPEEALQHVVELILAETREGMGQLSD